MQITNLGFGFGNAVQGKRFTITWNDLVGTAATTATQALYSLLRGSIILGCRIRHTQAFVGAGITSLGVTVGSTNLGVSGVASSFDLLQAVAAGVHSLTNVWKDGPDADETINAYFTAVGGNLSALTAGSVDIDIIHMPMTTPQS